MTNEIDFNVLISEINKKIKYDPLTGDFIWIVTSGKAKAFKKAGSVYKNGYLYIEINGKAYRAHRLAWLLYYNNLPLKAIDHIDRNKLNNAISNLREATNEENNQNKVKPLKTNKLGVLGVTFRYGKYHANIMKDKKAIYLGKFKTIEEASNAYWKAKSKLHISCTNLKR